MDEIEKMRVDIEHLKNMITNHTAIIATLVDQIGSTHDSLKKVRVLFEECKEIMK